MIERRGDRKYNEPMPPDEAKARIIRSTRAAPSWISVTPISASTIYA